ncbi:hypothetical protein KIN34_06335 [Cellulomonas sp. DKR-3]|uniref:Abortive infection protein-like C-terminal domain-containing protein n=1 Tax=Cellulomonas fulva TaxID=2835530 RepID=A0ABS5TXL5_9CELL|nr:hypothetical protein [Cellulomonas fulva]MBT0993903.1 hypothetical protein [Cellulomonas fulva]
MTEHTFYSDRLNGPPPAIHDTLPATASRGLLSLLDTKINANWLAKEFPERCPDGHGTYDTDVAALAANLQALVPGAPWPLLHPDAAVGDETVFDVVEYAAARVAEPVNLQYHSFFGHYELRFNDDEGRAKFRSDVNAILQRGRTMYELTENGEVHRRGTAEVQSVMAGLNPASGDARLDELIGEARSLYTSHRASDRAVALERLWDAFERLKTIDLPGGDKKLSIEKLLSNLDATWRPTIEAEMTTLTNLGNNFAIRHHETRTTPVPEGSASDYLFARMGALITELLAASRRLRPAATVNPWDL